mmetsp:Transcript_20316/g.44210  ORF Transcript_20316/g.44210 Transcript_20316/m.44210 type:complete len:301 (-) Transcript_20316:176-1078(-)|eukprot:CAMPEP_0168182240 /NCGR_PEP_ID=MMETSP0139_2-20121125/11757_1 /TAXON_ID=44445 /ORGANISM="Pseudo-nitzschia australis, Strain 10249 10 AB" /LENGTH=300 /DNA_ID=CAMNT_0008103095 /DNA_START=86 /DNA_END=988 /DNA_ORIENTATION=+
MKDQAPPSLTMDRLGDRDELIIAQSTSQCCRMGCLQPSINWIVAEGNNFEPGSNPFNLASVGWIHEESSFVGRCFSNCAAGCRGVKYVQHSGPAPTSLLTENTGCCTCQFEETSSRLTNEERKSNVVVTHEKTQSCGVFCCWLPCVCNPCGLPYLVTKDASTGVVLGRTQYICDLCCFVPKYDIFDGSGRKKFLLRPETCVGGCCVVCRCGGKKGKCCTVPFIIRDPTTQEPVQSSATLDGKPINSMVDTLWSGWTNECCSKKTAYHLTFPPNITAEEKAVLMGSTLLVDVTVFEQEGDE